LREAAGVVGIYRCLNTRALAKLGLHVLVRCCLSNEVIVAINPNFGYYIVHISYLQVSMYNAIIVASCKYTRFTGPIESNSIHLFGY
jgi:hypothetical protein